MGQLARQRIWQSKGTNGNERMVLLALADTTPDDCFTCYPSVQTLADMSGVSPRQAQRIIQALVAEQLIAVVLGRGRNHTTRYAVLVGLNDQEYVAAHEELGIPTKGDIAMSPNIPSESHKGDIKGDKKHDIAMSPLLTIKGDISEEKVTSETIKGDIAMSPEQNKQKREQKISHTASDDADGAQVEEAVLDTPPNRPPRGKSPGAPKPPVPVEVRQAIAKGSGIDLDAGLKEDIQQVNTISRRLWDNYRNEGETAATMVLRIRYSGKWIRINQHPYNKNQKQRIPPAAHIKFWPDSQADYDKEQAAANGAYQNGTNGHHSDFDYSALPNPYEAQAERQRLAAERRAARKAGAS